MSIKRFHLSIKITKVVTRNLFGVRKNVNSTLLTFIFIYIKYVHVNKAFFGRFSTLSINNKHETTVDKQANQLVITYDDRQTFDLIIVTH